MSSEFKVGSLGNKKYPFLDMIRKYTFEAINHNVCGKMFRTHRGHFHLLDFSFPADE